MEPLPPQQVPPVASPAPPSPVIISHKYRPLIGGIAVVLGASLAVVAGFLLFSNYFPTGEEAVPVVSSTPDPIAGWKTYTNPTYAFTVSHQSSWHSEECNNQSPEGAYILVSFGNADRLIVCNSDAPLQGIFTVGAGPGKILEQTIISTVAALDSAIRTITTIDGVNAVRVDGITRENEGPGPKAGQAQISIWAERGGILYSFFFTGHVKDVRAFEQTLATFKFGK
jgi:hypothetical protein